MSPSLSDEERVVSNSAKMNFGKMKGPKLSIVRKRMLPRLLIRASTSWNQKLKFEMSITNMICNICYQQQQHRKISLHEELNRVETIINRVSSPLQIRSTAKYYGIYSLEVWRLNWWKKIKKGLKTQFEDCIFNFRIVDLFHAIDLFFSESQN